MPYSRTTLLVGEEGMQKIRQSHVLVVGLGGVGGYAAEMLCRAGVGTLTLVDGDRIQASNRNRQIIALLSTENQNKTDAFQKRFADINPDTNVHLISEFLYDSRIETLLDASSYDYVVDAIDTLSPKLLLIHQAYNRHLPLVSSMGSGGKLDPTLVQAVDISQTHTCPLAAIIRKKLHRLGVYNGFTAVFSPEKTMENAVIEDFSTHKRTTVGTISYLPSVFGCVCASVVLRGILGHAVVPSFKDNRRYQSRLNRENEWNGTMENLE